jgi:hypothetical protein
MTIFEPFLRRRDSTCTLIIPSSDPYNTIQYDVIDREYKWFELSDAQKVAMEKVNNTKPTLLNRVLYNTSVKLRKHRCTRWMFRY